MRAEVRHQLKQDRFSRTTIDVAERTMHWSVDHKNKLIVGAIILVVVISAALGSWYYLEQQDEKASVDFGKATQVMETAVRPAGMPAQPDYPSFASSTERATEARKDFQGIVNKYPHTRAADGKRFGNGRGPECRWCWPPPTQHAPPPARGSPAPGRLRRQG